ncbi:MAG: hypothetical protein WCL06_03550 [Bacteroidota bacterium]
MKKLHRILVKSVLFIFCLIFLTSCTDKKWKVFDVKCTKIIENQAIKYDDIKFISTERYFWHPQQNSGFYAINVKEISREDKEYIEYSKLKDEYVATLNLSIDRSWFSRYWQWLFVLLLISVYLFFMLNARKVYLRNKINSSLHNSDEQVLIKQKYRFKFFISSDFLVITGIGIVLFLAVIPNPAQRFIINIILEIL